VRRYLTPTMLGAHLLALVAVGIAVGLGVWQYDAWQASRTAEAIDLSRSEPVPLQELVGPDQPLVGTQVGQPVTVSGTWVPDGTVFVSGREQDGRTGVWVVTPLSVGGPDDPAVPIVRGWAESPEAAPAPPTGAAEVLGVVQPPEGTGALDEDPLDDVYPQLRIADLVQRTDSDLYAAYAVLTDGAPGTNTGAKGLEPATVEQLPEPDSFTGIRNLLYALEWWVFGAFAAFIWWRFVREHDPAPAPAHPVALDA
jgi:cytochrome oxidase assembly protein ShyY1